MGSLACLRERCGALPLAYLSDRPVSLDSCAHELALPLVVSVNLCSALPRIIDPFGGGPGDNDGLNWAHCDGVGQHRRCSRLAAAARCGEFVFGPVANDTRGARMQNWSHAAECLVAWPVLAAASRPRLRRVGLAGDLRRGVLVGLMLRLARLWPGGQRHTRRADAELVSCSGVPRCLGCARRSLWS